LSEDERIIIGPPVYVFESGEVGHYGLSLFRDGSNLPVSVDGTAPLDISSTGDNGG
jgi:hypothetical protein